MMSCSPEELQKKSQELLAKWQACQAQPGFDGLVEFAVTVSSLTEFLETRGLSGLHQSAHALEQKVLSQFDQTSGTALGAEALQALSQQVQEFLDRAWPAGPAPWQTPPPPH